MFDPFFMFYGGTLYAVTGAFSALVGHSPRVAYVASSQIWIANADGSNGMRLTDDSTGIDQKASFAGYGSQVSLAAYGAWNAMKNKGGKAEHANAKLEWLAYIGDVQAA